MLDVRNSSSQVLFRLRTVGQLLARGCSVSCSKLIVVLDRVVCLPNIRLQMRVQRYFLSVVSTFRMRAFSIVISIRMRCREFLMVSVDSESTCRPAVRGPCPCLRKNEWCPVDCDLLHSYCVPSASCYCCPLALCPCVLVLSISAGSSV